MPDALPGVSDGVALPIAPPKAEPLIGTDSTAPSVDLTPEIRAQLLMQQLEFGYRLVTFYTACVTAYLAMVGFAAQFYFSNLDRDRRAALLVASFGVSISMLSIVAPFGLEMSRRAIVASAREYATNLVQSEHSFTIVRVGTWLSLALFVVITAAWMIMFANALP